MSGINLELKNEDVLNVCSNYDSGKHLGITIATQEKGVYGQAKGLEELLTKEQIMGLEAVIAYTVMSYLEEEK